MSYRTGRNDSFSAKLDAFLQYGKILRTAGVRILTVCLILRHSTGGALI